MTSQEAELALEDVENDMLSWAIEDSLADSTRAAPCGSFSILDALEATPQKRKHKKKRHFKQPLTEEDCNSKKNRKVYIEPETETVENESSKMDNSHDNDEGWGWSEVSYRADNELKATLPHSELSKEYLAGQFGDAYREGLTHPRRFGLHLSRLLNQFNDVTVVVEERHSLPADWDVVADDILFRDVAIKIHAQNEMRKQLEIAIWEEDKMLSLCQIVNIYKEMLP